MQWNRKPGDSGHTLVCSCACPDVVAALDAVDEELELREGDAEAWSFLRLECRRDPKRGRRVAVTLTLISRNAVHELRQTRRSR